MAGALVSQASLEQSDPDTELLPRTLVLAVESYRIRPSLGADIAIRRALALVPTIVRRTPINGVRAEAFSADGRLMVGEDLATQRKGVWSTDTGRLVKELPATVLRARLSDDGRLLAYRTGEDVDGDSRFDLVLAWGPDYGKKQQLGIPDLDTYEFSPDGRQFLVITEQHDGPGRDLSVYRAALSGKFELAGDGSYPERPAYARFHLGGQLVVGGTDFTAVLASDGKEQWRIPESGPIEFSRDGGELVVGQNVYSWTTHTENSALGGVGVPADRTRLLRPSGGVLQVLHATSGDELWRINSDPGAYPVLRPGPFAIPAEGRVMTMASGEVLVWDVDTDDLRTPVSGTGAAAHIPTGVFGLSETMLSRDGKKVAGVDVGHTTVIIASLDRTFKQTAERRFCT